MNKIMLKKGLFWALNNEGIIFYYTNTNLRKIIKSENDEKLFELLKFISDPKSEEEISRYCSNMEIKDSNSIVQFLLRNKYAEILTSEFTIENKEKRIANFIGTFPDTAYKDYKYHAKNLKFCFLGLGTAGSYTLDALLKMGFYNATLIDNDIVEEHNVISQNFSYADVGKSKAKILKDKYNNLSPDYNIQSKSEFIKNFKHLNEIVDLTSFDYLFLFADDYLLTLEIIENIFSVNPNIKLIQSGYAVLEVESIVITSRNCKVILEKLKNDHENYKSLKGVIVENSGTILESYMIAITTVKQVVDHLLNLSCTEYMKTDFLTNEYFIGSQFEYLYNKSSNNKIKELIYNIKEDLGKESERWIEEITNENFFINNIIKKPKLDKKQYEYIIENSNNESNLSFFVKNKSHLESNEYVLINENIEYIKKHIFDKVLEYVRVNFTKNIYNSLKNTIENEYIYTYRNKYINDSSLTIKNNNSIFIFNCLDGTTSNYNMLIHELFHAVFYFMGQEDMYRHEKFVFKHHMEMLTFFKEDDIFKILYINFIFNHIHIYICNSLSLDYEKYTLEGNINKFFDKWGYDDIEEMIEIVSSNINPFSPLYNYKYIYAINENINTFINHVENITLNTDFSVKV